MLIRHGRRRGATGIAGIALGLLVLASCGTARPVTPTPDSLAGTYAASGGGGALPAIKALAARFKELHPGVEWVISESGSNAAIKLAVSNTIDVGFVSRALTDAEKVQVTGIPIGFTGTAVVVNKANPVSDLSKEQLRQIFAGELTTWSGLSGAEAMVRPYIRETNAPTRQTLEAFIWPGVVPTYGKNVVQQTEVQAMFAAVGSFRGAIGIASTGSRTDGESKTKVVKIDGVAATQENVASGAYQMVRPLAIIFSNTTELKPAVRAFLEFVKSPEGQRVAATAY